MKPIVWMGKELTNYLIKEDGSVFNVKLNRWLKSKVPDTYGYMRYGLHVPLDFYEDYNYKINNPNGRTRCVTIRTHKALMNTFRPVDEYPPIPKEDWDKCPECAKQWIRDTVYVDHINGVRTDNRLENLCYVTPRQNSNHYKNKLNETQNP
jgi:hypothetical protein